MLKSDAYRETLGQLDAWEPFLRAHSGLPGPRGNLELAQAAADEGSEEQFRRWAALDAESAPENSPDAFVVVCGAIGLGRLLAEGRHDVLPLLRRLAADARWRVREGVAMALQRWGDRDVGALLEEMESWAEGSALERRAAVAALCEPRLLRLPAHARATLRILDTVTAGVASGRKGDDFRVLRQALGYAWSVAVAADPEAGKRAMEAWLACADADVRWILRENLKKDRLRRLDAAWVDACRRRLDGESVT